MHIQTLLEMAKTEELTDEKVIGMILSNRIDMGYEGGGLISVKQFDNLASDLKQWHDWKNQHNYEVR